MRNPIMLLAFVLCGVCQPLHAQWSQLSVPTDTNYQRTYCVTVHKDWFLAGTNNGVYRTQDPSEAQAWTHSSEGLASAHAYSVHSDGDLVLVHAAKGMRLSTDDGATWSVPTWSPPSGSSFSFTVIDGTWYMGGVDVTAQKSTDKGATWTEICSVPGSYVFTRYGHWQLRVWDGLWRTTDDGATWTKVHSMPLVEPHHMLWVTDQQDLFYTRQSITTDTFMRSTDGGITFEDIQLPEYARRIYFEIGPVLFIAGASSALYSSTDRGSSWQLATAPFSNVIRAMNTSRGFLFAFGYDGSMFWAMEEDVVKATSVDEAVSGAQCAVRDARFVRGSVPYTTIHVERDVDVDAYNVLGERVGTWRLEAGEHTLFTPEPSLLVRRR